jgi:hypothetical protein
LLDTFSLWEKAGMRDRYIALTPTLSRWERESMGQ